MPAQSKFKAVRSFSVAGRRFEAGDVVDGRALEVAMTHGDVFVKVDTSRTRKEAVDGSTSDTTEESP